MTVSLRLLWLVFAIVLYFLAFQGNIGKGIACFVSPGTLEVINNGDQSQPSGPTQPE